MGLIVNARISVLIFALCSTASLLADDDGGTPISTDARAVLSKYCVDCHSGEEPDGALDLDVSTIKWRGPAVRESIAKWEHVHSMLSKQIMPPPDSEQPSADERHVLLNWLDRALIKNSPVGGTPLRRLSRREYANTIRDVFGLDKFQLPDSFPPDNKLHGFDNQGQALVIAVSHLEAFADTATLVADEFFAPPRPDLDAQEFVIPAKDLVISYSSACLIDGTMRLASSGTNIRRNATWPARFEAPANGRYTIEITASAFQPPADAPILQVSVYADGKASKDPLKAFKLDEEQPQTFQAFADLDRGDSIVMRYPNGPYNYEDKTAFTKLLKELFTAEPILAAAWDKVGNPARGGTGWERVVEAMEDPKLDATEYSPDSKAVTNLINTMLKKSVNSGETLVYRYFENGPAVGIHEVRISGPHKCYPDRDDLRIAEQCRRLMGDAFEKSDKQSLQKFFAGFLEDVLRRTVTQGEVDQYTKLVTTSHKATGDLNAALHLAVRTALISPEFVYRNVGPEQLTGFAMANRLSYFLTSGPPDQELRSVAASGKLHRSEILQREAKRILNSAFAQDFTTQWLGLESLDNLMPDARLIRKFTPEHRNTMRDEVVRTFAHVLDRNLPVRDFIAPDFLFTDALVGWEIYQLEQFKPPKKGSKSSFNKKMQQVSIPRDKRRGGLLSMPAVMMATANGVDTQPVLRGVWMLENILGSPSPEPPNAVPALTPDTTGASTPKARLAAHMQSQSCAVCHRDIDPLGFVLENYDPIGRWRDHYPLYSENKDGTSEQVDGAEVDATGVLPNGVPLNDVTDLKRWLASNPAPFARCLSERLLTYATGRTLNYRERSIVADRVKQQADNDYRFRDLLLSLIDSEVFRSR